MLTLGSGLRVYLALEAVDMRGSFNALQGKARHLGLEPSDGNLYLFIHRRRRLCKMLWFDGSGWCIFSKRLEKGTFELPDVANQATEPPRVVIDAATLASLLEGIDLRAQRRKWYRRAA